MKVKAIYKIGKDYVIGDDKNIYKLPFVVKKKNFSLRKLKQHRGGFFLNKIWVDKKSINYESIEPYVLIEESNLPF